MLTSDRLVPYGIIRYATWHVNRESREFLRNSEIVAVFGYAMHVAGIVQAR